MHEILPINIKLSLRYLKMRQSGGKLLSIMLVSGVCYQWSEAQSLEKILYRQIMKYTCSPEDPVLRQPMGMLAKTEGRRCSIPAWPTVLVQVRELCHCSACVHLVWVSLLGWMLEAYSPLCSLPLVPQILFRLNKPSFWLDYLDLMKWSGGWFSPVLCEDFFLMSDGCFSCTRTPLAGHGAN